MGRAAHLQGSPIKQIAYGRDKKKIDKNSIDME